MILASQPWDWLGPVFDSIRGWLDSDAVRELPGNSALFLIVGGLSILSLIVFLVVLQSLIPTKGPLATLADERPVDRQLRPARPRANLPRPLGGGTSDTGRNEARYVRATELTGILDQAVLRGIGEPRITHLDENRMRLRLLACGTCEPTFAAHRAPDATECAHERGFLEGALRRLRPNSYTNEVACRLQGHNFCEFEVVG